MLYVIQLESSSFLILFLIPHTGCSYNLQFQEGSEGKSSHLICDVYLMVHMYIRLFTPKIYLSHCHCHKKRDHQAKMEIKAHAHFMLVKDFI